MTRKILCKIINLLVLLQLFAAPAYASFRPASSAATVLPARPENAARWSEMSALLAGPCGSSYVIRQGDTLSAIARRCGVDVRTLARANGLSLQSVIYAGRRLTIPGATSAAAASGGSAPNSVAPSRSAGGCASSYTVRRGDTLGAIAARCGVSVRAIMQWNGLRSDVIGVGQRLVIRGTATAPVAPVSQPAPRVAPGSRVPVTTPVPAEPVPAAPAPAAVIVAEPPPTPTPSIESPPSHW